MVELKPCPFCGGSAERLELEDEANFGGSVICCQKCGASSPVHFNRKENLYDSWNRRTEARQDDELEAEVAKLREALERIVRHPIETPVAGRPDIGFPGIPSCQKIASTALKENSHD